MNIFKYRDNNIDYYINADDIEGLWYDGEKTVVVTHSTPWRINGDVVSKILTVLRMKDGLKVVELSD